MLFWVWTNTLGSQRAARLHHNKGSERTAAAGIAEFAERSKMWLKVFTRITGWGSLVHADPGEGILAAFQAFPILLHRVTILKITQRMNDEFQCQPGRVAWPWHPSPADSLQWTTLSNTETTTWGFWKVKKLKQIVVEGQNLEKKHKGWISQLFSWQLGPEGEPQSRSCKGGVTLSDINTYLAPFYLFWPPEPEKPGKGAPGGWRIREEN